MASKAESISGVGGSSSTFARELTRNVSFVPDDGDSDVFVACLTLVKEKGFVNLVLAMSLLYPL